MPSPDLHGKTALITGAASGIGRATALAFARAGADLWLCDINGPGLDPVADSARALGRKVHTSVTDVSSKEAMKTLADEVHATLPALDVLVNNAGFAVGGLFVDTPLEAWEKQIAVNLWGPIYGCHFFVPRMIERGRGGHIFNIASAAGLFGTAGLSAYTVTKFALVGLSESMNIELHRHNIGVTAICPGVIQTNIANATQMHGPFADDRLRQSVTDFFMSRSQPPERVAERIVGALQSRPVIAPITKEAWALYTLKRISPELASLVARKAFEQMERKATQGK